MHGDEEKEKHKQARASCQGNEHACQKNVVDNGEGKNIDVKFNEGASEPSLVMK